MPPRYSHSPRAEHAEQPAAHPSMPQYSYSNSIWHGKTVQPTREPEAHGETGTKSSLAKMRSRSSTLIEPHTVCMLLEKACEDKGSAINQSNKPRERESQLTRVCFQPHPTLCRTQYPASGVKTPPVSRAQPYPSILPYVCCLGSPVFSQ